LLLGWYLRPAAQIDVKGAHVAQDTPDIRFWLNPASECVTTPAENFFMERVPFWARLRNAQREDVRMFARRRGLLVAHPCSGGKTLTGIAAAHVSGFPVLICAPAIARGVWTSELKKWAPDVRLMHLRGRDAQALTGQEADFYFVNYEVLASWGPKLTGVDWKTVILDEAHEIRGRRSKRVIDGYRRAVALSCPHVIGLTATPIWNRLDGLWTLLDFIHPGWFGTYGAFVKRYMNAEISWQHGGLLLGKATNTAELQGRLGYTIRRLSVEELLPELPDMERLPVFIENEGAAARLHQAVSNMAAKSNHGDLTTEQVRQVLGSALQRETKLKLPALREFIEARPGKKILVAAQYKASVVSIANSLSGYLDEVHSFTGDQTLEQRMAIFARIAALPSDKTAAVVCTMASARQSIDASCMDGVAVLELPWTVEELIQFEGRVRRVTRTADVEAGYFVVDASIDRHLLEMLASKFDERSAALGEAPDDFDFSALLSTALTGRTSTRSELLAQFGL
jgi:superfamily II DNA or RNA helicase